VVSAVRCLSVAALLHAGCGRYFFDETDHQDGGTTGDAVADAMADAFDCGHTFCDDFDRSGPPEAGWDMITMSTGTMALVSDTSVSGPQSLLVTIPTDGTTLTGNAFLHKQLPMTTTKAVVHLQLQYSTAMTMNTEADFLALQWDTLPPGCTSFGYYLVRDGTGPFNLQETYGDAGTGGVCAGGSVQNYNLDLDNTAMFNDVTMEVTFGAMGTAWLKLTINGSVVVDKMATHPIDPSTLTLQLGGGISRNGLAPWTIRVDELTVDLDR
jgi:hypothetical protein